MRPILNAEVHIECCLKVNPLGLARGIGDIEHAGAFNQNWALLGEGRHGRHQLEAGALIDSTMRGIAVLCTCPNTTQSAFEYILQHQA